MFVVFDKEHLSNAVNIEIFGLCIQGQQFGHPEKSECFTLVIRFYSNVYLFSQVETKKP